MPALRVSLAALVLATACGPKLERQLVFDRDDVRVEVRRTIEGGQPVARGYNHPAVISDVRVAHILAQLTHAAAGGEERAVVRAEHVYALGEGLNRAFARATPDEEVVAVAVFTGRRFGLFTHERVTAFRAFFEADFLALEFYAIDEEFDRDAERGRGYEVPLAPPQRSRLRLVPGTAQVARGAGGLLVDWRDPHFRNPVPMRPGTGTVRRTVLMEDEAPELEPVRELEVEALSPELRDAQLHALDQLDAARRAGLVTEADFRRRRRLVLEGRLEEAGYTSPAP